MKKSEMQSKAYLQCQEIYKSLYHDYTEDRLKEGSNPSAPLPQDYQTVFLNIPKSDLENEVAVYAGFDERTLKKYIMWLKRLRFVKQLNPNTFVLLPREDGSKHQLKLDNYG